MLQNRDKLLVLFSYEQLLVHSVHMGDFIKNKVWYEENFSFLLGYFKRNYILNLDITLINFKNSLIYMEKVASKKLKAALVFSSYILVRRVLAELDLMVKYGLYYTHKRWIGGILTNFKSFRKYIFFILSKKYFRFKNTRYSIKIDRWTRLYNLYCGFRGCKIVPSFVFNSNNLLVPWPVHEANSLSIPLSSLIDTTSPLATITTFVIPANDESFKAIIFFLVVYKNSFLVGLLKRKREFLFFINLALNYLRINNIEYYLMTLINLIYILRRIYFYLCSKKKII
jgi:small subunit ribosomal protein S2